MTQYSVFKGQCLSVKSQVKDVIDPSQNHIKNRYIILINRSRICFPHFIYLKLNTRASLVAQLVKNPSAMQETPVLFLGREDPLEKG